MLLYGSERMEAFSLVMINNGKFSRKTRDDDTRKVKSFEGDQKTENKNTKLAILE